MGHCGRCCWFSDKSAVYLDPSLLTGSSPAFGDNLIKSRIKTGINSRHSGEGQNLVKTA